MFFSAAVPESVVKERGEGMGGVREQHREKDRGKGLVYNPVVCADYLIQIPLWQSDTGVMFVFIMTYIHKKVKVREKNGDQCIKLSAEIFKLRLCFCKIFP